MTFVELKKPEELAEFIQANPLCLVTFSATWCGPCKWSKPDLEALATKNPDVPFLYVYEHIVLEDDDDFLNSFTTIFCQGSITGYPTYMLFHNGGEIQRVNGVKLDEVQQMITTAQQQQQS